MKTPDCAREPEIARALLSRTPEALDDDLRSHAASCDVCREVVDLVEALRGDREDALADVRVPAAGQIWWRSAVRAHAEATEAARRPMVWLQGIAAASAAGIVVAILGFAWPSIYAALLTVAALPAALAPDMDALIGTVRSVLPVALAVLVCLVFTPLLVYLALSDK